MQNGNSLHLPSYLSVEHIIGLVLEPNPELGSDILDPEEGVLRNVGRANLVLHFFDNGVQQKERIAVSLCGEDELEPIFDFIHGKELSREKMPEAVQPLPRDPSALQIIVALDFPQSVCRLDLVLDFEEFHFVHAVMLVHVHVRPHQTVRVLLLIMKRHLLLLQLLLVQNRPLYKGAVETRGSR